MAAAGLSIATRLPPRPTGRNRDPRRRAPAVDWCLAGPSAAALRSGPAARRRRPADSPPSVPCTDMDTTPTCRMSVVDGSFARRASAMRVRLILNRHTALCGITATLWCAALYQLRVFVGDAGLQEAACQNRGRPSPRGDPGQVETLGRSRPTPGAQADRREHPPPDQPHPAGPGTGTVPVLYAASGLCWGPPSALALGQRRDAADDRPPL